MKTNPHNQLSEIVLTAQLEISQALSKDTLDHLEELHEDLAYISHSIEQAQGRFKTVLTENRKLKIFLQQMVKECWCSEGNRCSKCQKILLTLSRHA